MVFSIQRKSPVCVPLKMRVPWLRVSSFSRIPRPPNTLGFRFDFELLAIDPMLSPTSNFLSQPNALTLLRLWMLSVLSWCYWHWVTVTHRPAKMLPPIHECSPMQELGSFQILQTDKHIRVRCILLWRYRFSEWAGMDFEMRVGRVAVCFGRNKCIRPFEDIGFRLISNAFQRNIWAA